MSLKCQDLILSRTKFIFWSLNYQVYEIPYQLTMSGPTNHFLYSPDPQEFGLHALLFHLKWRLQHNHTDLLTVPCHALTPLCLRHPPHSPITSFIILSILKLRSNQYFPYHITYEEDQSSYMSVYSIKLSNVSWKLPILKKIAFCSITDRIFYGSKMTKMIFIFKVYLLNSILKRNLSDHSVWWLFKPFIFVNL